MEFPHSYFDDEIREGFYVSSIMKRLWAANIEVLLDIDKICQKHNIKYFADYGTLLGAIRHGGCIPWDDDFDICMLRDDYKEFIKYAEKELPEHYVVWNCHNDFEDLLTRINNSKVPSFDPAFLEKYHQCYLGAGVDIFPLDYMAPTKEAEIEHRNLIRSMYLFESLLNDDDLDEAELDNLLKEVEKLCGVHINREGDIKLQMYEAAEAACALYGPKNAKKVMLAPIWAASGTKEYPFAIFKDSVRVPYEGIEIPVAVDYDSMLKIEYSDYMRIVKGGASHDYPCFKEQEDAVIGQLGFYPFLYTFDPEALNEEKRLIGKKPGKVALRFAGLMRKAHKQIQGLFAINSYENAMQIFESCQNAAIHNGTLLEEQFGEGFEPVSCLEQYCEMIFQGYQIANMCVEEGAVGIDVSELIEALDVNIQAFEDSIKENVKDSKEKVFIVYRSRFWDALEPVWKEAKESGEYEVTVIVPPYYDRKADGEFSTMYDESGELPDYVEVTPYDAYDFEGRHPEEIIIQSPYDECNYTTSVHTFYYSKNLRQFTDKLTYIPYFVMDEIDLANEKMVQTMKYFCTVPGLFYADEVIVQSENTRHAYIEVLTKFAGEETRGIWEKKILGAGSPLMIGKEERVARKKQQIIANLPEYAKELAEKNPVIVFEMNAASFSQFETKAIEKLKYTLSQFEAVKEKITFIWRENIVVERMLASAYPNMYEEYVSLRNEFKEKAWGIYDDFLSIEDACILADGYYGDTGRLARMCETAGKQVMIEDINVGEDTPESIPFNIRAAEMVGDDLYFFPKEYNLLCVKHMSTGKIEILGSIPDESITSVDLILNIHCKDGKLYLVPMCAKSIWIYNLYENSWTRINVDDSELVYKFGASYLSKDRLYVFPWFLQEIFSVDLNTNEIVRYPKIEAMFQDCKIDGKYRFSRCISRIQDDIYVLCWGTNSVLRWNLKTDDAEKIQLGISGGQYNNMFYDGVNIWLIPRIHMSIAKCNLEGNVTEYELPNNVEFALDGLIGCTKYNNRLYIIGRVCDSIIYDYSKDEFVGTTTGESDYTVHTEWGAVIVNYLLGYTELYYDDRREQIDNKYLYEEIYSYINNKLIKNGWNFHGLIRENSSITVQLLVAAMQKKY